MEAGGLLSTLKAELRGLDTRVEGIDRGLTDVRGRTESNNTKIEVIRNELKNVSEDIQELKGSMKWVLRGLFGAIAVGLMFTVAVISLVVQST